MLSPLKLKRRLRLARKIASLALLCLPASGIFGQLPAAAPSQTYNVRGAVLDSVTHEPIPRAMINAQQDATLTDSEGRFELHLPAVTVQMQVERPGYTPSPQMVQVDSDVSLPPFNLKPTALISGQVTLSNSEPADSIRIMLYKRFMVYGRPQWQMQQGATTGSQGAYRIAGLSPGAYLVYTNLEPDQDSSRNQAAPAAGYAAAYYPGVPEASSASVLTLTPGQHAQADFNLSRQPFFPVTVKVTNTPATSGTALQIYQAGGVPAQVQMISDPDPGTTHFSLPDGNYFLEVRSGGGQGAQPASYGRLDFKVAGAPLSGLTLTPSPLINLPVNIQKEFTAPPAPAPAGGVVGSIAPDNPEMAAGLSLVLTPASQEIGVTPYGGGSLHSINGGRSFQLEGVSPGLYWMNAFPFQGYVSSLSSAGVDLTREPLLVGPGGVTAPVDAVLRDDVGLIKGRIALSDGAQGDGPQSTGETGLIRAGKRQTQYYPYAVPLNSNGQFATGAIEPNGDFIISNLAPGSYRVGAFDVPPEEIAFRTPEGLEKYSKSGQTVSVASGATVNVQLDSVQTEDTP